MKKTSSFPWQVWALCSIIGASASAATLSVSPAEVSNEYTGSITLSITGLTNGEPVRIRKCVDANANGILDETDLMVQAFQVIDGQAMVIAGVTNLNVPGDSTPADGAITTRLSFVTAGFPQQLVARYLFVLSSPFDRFAPVTNTFTVTNANHGQSFSGVITEGTNAAPYATVLLFVPDPDGEGGEPGAGAVADATGYYLIQAPVGTYMPLGFRDGSVSSMATAPLLALGSGSNITANLSVLPADRTISGRVFDVANTNRPLPGVFVVCESQDGMIAPGHTDTNGNFVIPVVSGLWKCNVDDPELAAHGYVRLSEEPVYNTSTGSVAGVAIAVPKGTALVYGRVENEQNQPFVGFGVYGDEGTNGSGSYEGDATTDENGNYTMAVVAGTWNAGDDSDNAFASYMFGREWNQTNISSGQAIRQNFLGVLATNHISGYVRDSGFHPITNIDVYAYTELNGLQFNLNTETDSSGDYSLNAGNATWNVGVNGDHLEELGYVRQPNQQTNVLNNDVIVNFIVSDLQITNDFLPGGVVGDVYSTPLGATGGTPPYTWSLTPGPSSLPPGLTLSTNGILSGTPESAGFYGFWVRVSDSGLAVADRELFVNIQMAPLMITTTNLPDGIIGTWYSEQIQATGGQQPYHWYLPEGSMALPPGLDLSTNGTLSGTPLTNGTWGFNVAVYVDDPYYMSSTQYLSLTITPEPVHVTTTSPLPNGTVGTAYSLAFAAAGGTAPYSWSLAPGSPSLPAGLLLDPDGELHGIPTVSGGFWFVVRVTDSLLATNDALAALTIDPASMPSTTLTSPRRLSNGQFEFSFNTLAGTNYTIQFSTNLSSPWVPVITIVGSGSPLTIIDPNAAGGGPRFYRLKIGP